MFIDWCWADDVLSTEECELLAKIGKANLEEATTIGDVGPEARQGSVCWFKPGEYPEADPTLEKIVARFTYIVEWYWGYKLKDVKPIQLAFY